MSDHEFQYIAHVGPADEFRELTDYDLRRQIIRDEAEAAKHLCHGSGATAARELIEAQKTTALLYLDAREELGKTILRARMVLDRVQEQRTREALGRAGLL